MTDGPRREPKDRLTLSIHIPKTAGVRFGEILRNHHGKACALYYGADDPRTHELLRVRPREIDAARLNALAESGVKVIHGHVRPRALVEVMPNPRNYAVWLREPIEHTLSRYHLNEPGHPVLGPTKAADLTVEAYVRLPEIANFQSDYIRPLELGKIGFVGITELFEPMLSLLDLADTAHRTNVNPDKPVANQQTRLILAEHLLDDIALYSQAMELAIRRLGLRDVKQLARYKQSAEDLARRFGAEIAPSGRPLKEDP